MALFEANNLPNTKQADDGKSVYTGIVTRKRAALNKCSVLQENKSNQENRIKLVNNKAKIQQKENKITPNIIDRQLIKSELILNLNLNHLINNPLHWPNSSDFLNNNDLLKNTFKAINDRRHEIRRFYSLLYNNNDFDIVDNPDDTKKPIWFPSDINNIKDEFMHIEYLPTILDNLMEKEEFYEPLFVNFLEGASDITHRHRYSLVDWMVQMSDRLNMSNESLQLSIAMMDRFVKVMKSNLKREDVLIIGVMCLYIATKIEEVNIYTLPEFLEEVDVKYSIEKCRLLEEKIVSVLNFKLSIPLPLAFIRHFNIMFKGDTISHLYSRYFCELSLHDYLASGYSSNMIGASCVFLAQVICQNVCSDFAAVWTPALQCSSGLLYTDFKDLVKNLCIIISKQQTPSKYRAIAVKYSSLRFKYVAKTVIQTVGFKSILQYFKSTLM